jgi:hypothetical protein
LHGLLVVALAIAIMRTPATTCYCTWSATVGSSPSPYGEVDLLVGRDTHTRKMGKWIWCVLSCVGCFNTADNSGDDDGSGLRPDARIDAPTCTRIECAAVTANCGDIDDGCGATRNCGTCAGPSTCGARGTANVCAIPLEERTCAGAWCYESPAPTIPFDPTKIVARTATDVWAIGARGTVMRSDGTGWERIESGTTEDLLDVWMASDSDGWFVGEGGTILRWNGTGFAPVVSGTTATLTGVHGIGTNDVVIVGDRIALRWNGSNLANVTAVAPSVYLNDVAIVGSTIFAVGSGRIWRADTVNWTSVVDTDGDSLPYIATNGTTAFAIGRYYSILSPDDEHIYRYANGTWSYVEHPGDPEFTDIAVDGQTIYGVSDESFTDLTSANLDRIAGPSATILAAGAAQGAKFTAGTGGKLWTSASGSWVPSHTIDRPSMKLAATTGDTLWIAGGGTLYEWRDGLFQHDVGTGGVTSIVGRSRGDVWINKGSAGTAHFDGTAWSSVASPSLVSLEMTESGQLFGIDNDSFARREGTGWVTEASPVANVSWVDGAATGETVYAIGNTTNVTPPQAHVARRENDAWTLMALPAVEHVCGILALSPTDIWIDGNDGKRSPETPTAKVAHWNGATWTVTSRAGTSKLCTLAMVGTTLYATDGTSEAVHQRDASGTWTTERVLASGGVAGIAVTATAIWAVGNFHAIVRKDR